MGKGEEADAEEMKTISAATGDPTENPQVVTGDPTENPQVVTGDPTENLVTGNPNENPQVVTGYPTDPSNSCGKSDLYDGLSVDLVLNLLERIYDMDRIVGLKEKDELGTLSILPPDIIRNILSRIPLKNFVQLSCLSYGWHVRVFDQLYSNSKIKILIPSNPLHSIDVSEYSFEEHPESTIDNVDTHITIVGSLDGSAILMVDTTDTDSHVLFLYNPLTEIIIPIPQQPIETHDYMCDGRVYGFGYSHTSGDAIIVILSESRGYGDMYSSYFSFTTKSWHPLNCKKADVTITSVAATFIEKNRKLYWIAKKHFPDSNTENIALSLDLKTMNFEEIYFGSAFPIHTMGTFNGDLCALLFVREKEDLEEEEEEEKQEKEEEEEKQEEEREDEDEEEREDEDEEDEEVLRLIQQVLVEEEQLQEERDYGHLWWFTANKLGSYQVRVLNSKSNNWNTIHITTLSKQQEFGKFYVLTFLDQGAILFKVFNKENQDSILHVYNIHDGSTLELTVPPTLHVGNSHATEYQDSVEGLAALCFKDDVPGSPSSSSSSSSSSFTYSPPSSFMDECPSYEIEAWKEYYA